MSRISKNDQLSAEKVLFCYNFCQNHLSIPKRPLPLQYYLWSLSKTKLPVNTVALIKVGTNGTKSFGFQFHLCSALIFSRKTQLEFDYFHFAVVSLRALKKTGVSTRGF